MIKNKIFNGNRLKSTRIYRGKTQQQLSKDIGISIESIDKIENGEETPGVEYILRMCKILNFSKDYFYEQDNLDLVVENTYFEKHYSQYKIEELSNIEKMVLTHKIFNPIERYLTLPKLSIIHLEYKNNDMDKIADKVRNHYKLGDGQIYNMVSLLESNGFIISTINSSKSSVGAYTQKSKIYDVSRYFIAVGNDKKSVPRRNYDLAVQLGHVVLHDSNINKNISKEEHEIMKEESNNFARCFLLPKESFLNDLEYASELESYISLKAKYIVPIKVMIYRAYELGAISYRKYEYLINEMSKLGWNKKEPLDDIKGANPIIPKKAVEILIENKIINSGGLVEMLSKEGISLYQEDIEYLLGLKKGKSMPKNNIENTKNNITVLNFEK